MNHAEPGQPLSDRQREVLQRRAPDLAGLARLLFPAAWERGASGKSREFALHQAKEVLAFLGISHDQREG